VILLQYYSISNCLLDVRYVQRAALTSGSFCRISVRMSHKQCLVTKLDVLHTGLQTSDTSKSRYRAASANFAAFDSAFY